MAQCYYGKSSIEILPFPSVMIRREVAVCWVKKNVIQCIIAKPLRSKKQIKRIKMIKQTEKTKQKQKGSSILSAYKITVLLSEHSFSVKKKRKIDLKVER